MEKAITISDQYESIAALNRELADGWKVKAMVGQHVSVACAGDSYNTKELKGMILVVLEKDQ